jgi:hypothetical protein
MPIEVIVELAARVSADVAIDTLLVVGSGDRRESAGARCFAFAVFAMAIAVALAWLLPRALADGGGALLAAGVLAVLGAYLTVRIVEEWQRLQRWGEPELTAGPNGLTITGRNRAIAWHDIRAVVPLSRSGRKSVRIDVAQERKAVLVRTSQPEKLAATILAEKRSRQAKP